jgi:hypothetical protein
MLLRGPSLLLTYIVTKHEKENVNLFVINENGKLNNCFK